MGMWPTPLPVMYYLSVCVLMIGGEVHAGNIFVRSRAAAGGTANHHSQGQCRQPLPPIAVRNGLAAILEAERAEIGVELGVQTGAFAADTLQQWSCNKKYYLVDIWAPLENYLDVANVGIEQQNMLYQEAQDRLQPWEDKTVFLKMRTTDAVIHIPDQVDYVYVDARHDYCGVTQDLEAYWPKLKAGGILAGHDFLTNRQVQDMTPQQDWSLCEDGGHNPYAVQGAVIDFARKHSLQVVVTYHESWPTWYIRKPCALH